MKYLLCILLLFAGIEASAATVTLSSGTPSCMWTHATITPAGDVTFTCAGSIAQLCEQRVTLLYREIMLRDPDPGGLQYWSARCVAGMTEAELRSAFEPYRPR